MVLIMNISEVLSNRTLLDVKHILESKQIGKSAHENISTGG